MECGELPLLPGILPDYDPLCLFHMGSHGTLENSMTTTLRATVMLLILVGVPVAWIYMGPLPLEAQQMVTRLIASGQERLGVVSSAVSGEPRIAAPRFDRPVRSKKEPLVDMGGMANNLADVEQELEQLRNMGVVEYALESWGRHGNLYRFHCSMPLGPSNHVTTQFEAVSENPRVSVRQVVHEVISWHRNRLGFR